MGPNSQPPGEIELYWKGAGPVQKKIADIPEVNMDFKGTENEAYNTEGDPIMSVSVEIPSSLRCTSRKRFVKLLMSCGVKRNAAVKVALLAARHGVSYQIHFFAVIFLLGKEKLEKEGINKNESGTFEQ